MEEYKNKSKQELLQISRELGEKLESMRNVILEMLDEFDKLEFKQKEINKIIKSG